MFFFFSFSNLLLVLDLNSFGWMILATVQHKRVTDHGIDNKMLKKQGSLQLFLRNKILTTESLVDPGFFGVKYFPGNDHISHQTGSSEHHRLKKCHFQGG